VVGHTRLDLATDGRGAERDRSVGASSLAGEAAPGRPAPGEAAGQWRRSGARSATSAHSGSWVSRALYEVVANIPSWGRNYTKALL
jgi:hypothetical protein